MHTGGRGKAGGIKLAKTPADAEEAAAKILGMDINGHMVNKVLIVPAVDIQREIYLGVILDRAQRQVSLMASAEGGVDIETVAHETPEKIVRVLADPYLGIAGMAGARCWIRARARRQAGRAVCRYRLEALQGICRNRCHPRRNQSAHRHR